MNNASNYIEAVGQIVEELERLNVMPILVGGMALVILGSSRVTQDFDFVISKDVLNYETLLEVFYKNGFELASKVDESGKILTTIDNQRVAAIRLRLDAPASVYFLNHKTGLRIDLLFDFPVSANELAGRAQKKKIRSYTIRVADKKDLLRLKEIAHKDRGLAADAQDLEFLKKLS